MGGFTVEPTLGLILALRSRSILASKPLVLDIDRVQRVLALALDNFPTILARDSLLKSLLVLCSTLWSSFIIL